MSKKKSNRYVEQAKSITSRLRGRDYVVGLDLGVGSIGLAVVAEDECDGFQTPAEVIFTTSRIFDPSAGAADRRQKRLQRNAIRHKRNRLEFLWKLLASRNLMLPFRETQKDILDPATVRFSRACRKQDPYKLRLKGLSEELPLDHLGYAIYHIANHRGASSIRTFLDEEMTDDDKKAKEQLKETEKLAREHNLSTFIEILWEFNKGKVTGFRNRDVRKQANLPLPTRDAIRNEIEKLLKTQSQFHSDVLTRDYCREIVEAVLYENPKIVPEAGPCPYFPNEQKLPKCHFLTEERRLWEALNNARVKKPFEARTCFSFDERHLLFSHLRSGSMLSEATVKKLLPQYRDADITLQGRDKKDQRIKGFRFRKLEEKSFWARFTEEQKDKFFYTWVNTPDDEQLRATLTSTSFGLSAEEADDALKTIQLVGDYAPMGKTATLLIMKHLEDGLTFTEAIEKCQESGELQERGPHKVFDKLPYYGEVLSDSTQACIGKAWHSAFKERRSSFNKPVTNSLEEKYGRIANPVVHQTLNELRKLMNEVIEIMGKKPAEITVELAREIKVGEKARDDISKEQARREKEAEAIYNKWCLPNNLTRKSIPVFRMLEQQKFVCPYCLKTMNAEDVLLHNVDVDHILPRAETADDSENNKVVAHKNCNLEKAKRTPYSAFGAKPIWDKIENYLDTTESMKGKKWRFVLTDEEYHEWLKSRGFLSRFGADNSYASKIAREYLSCLYPSPTKVTTLKGGETSLLRRAWNVQGIDDYLASFHYSDMPDMTPAKKNRTDNRHHSLDAIVAAYSTRSYIKKINTLSGQGKCAEEIKENLPVPNGNAHPELTRKEQIELFRKEIQSFLLCQGFVSIKQDNARNGQILKDTRYSIIATSGDDLICLVKKKMTDTKVQSGTIDEVEKSLNGKFIFRKEKYPSFAPRIEALQKENEKQLQRYISLLPKAKQLLEEESAQLVADGKKARKIDDPAISRKALELCGGIYNLLSNNTRKKIFVTQEPSEVAGGAAFDTGENLCIDLYHDDKGKLQGEIIRKVNAMNTSFVPTYKKRGYVLFERLYQGDILELSTDGISSETKMAVATKATTGNASPHRVFMKIQTFTEVGGKGGIQIYISNMCKSNSAQDASFYITSMQKYSPRKITLSSAGLVKFVSPVLQDRQKEEGHVESH